MLPRLKMHQPVGSRPAESECSNKAMHLCRYADGMVRLRALIIKIAIKPFLCLRLDVRFKGGSIPS